MATAYFVREGTGERATDAGREVSLTAITYSFKNAKLKWFPDAPTFGSKEPANAFSHYIYVVVHVNNDETNGLFNKAGYWLLRDITPSNFENYYTEHGDSV